MMHFAAPLLAYAALVGPSSPRAPVPRSAVRMADSGPIAQALKELKTKYEVPWLAEGDGSPSNKVNMPEYVREVLAQPGAPRRSAESADRVSEVRARAERRRPTPPRCAACSSARRTRRRGGGRRRRAARAAAR